MVKKMATTAPSSMETYNARVESFAPQRLPKRRASNNKKKTTTTAAWPHETPTPEELAFAGFYFKPTTTSPDNVQCFICHRQLDGWEPGDNPAFEHATHSPDCGFAINQCIKLRNGDPNRAEEDPMSFKMVDARRMTFADYWPLEGQAGYPQVDQLVDAGWCYDPSVDHKDGVTCPYCSLSLDEWDIDDNPTKEHQKRSADCLFFTLQKLYRPENVPDAKPKGKGGRKSRASRTSTASTAGRKAPARGKRAASKARESPVDSQIEIQLEPRVEVVINSHLASPMEIDPPVKRLSEPHVEIPIVPQLDSPFQVKPKRHMEPRVEVQIEAPPMPKLTMKKTRGRKPSAKVKPKAAPTPPPPEPEVEMEQSSYTPEDPVPVRDPTPEPFVEPTPEPSVEPEPEPAPKRGRKPGSKAATKTAPKPKAAPKRASARTSTSSTLTQPLRTTRGVKRTSDGNEKSPSPPQASTPPPPQILPFNRTSILTSTPLHPFPTTPQKPPPTTNPWTPINVDAIFSEKEMHNFIAGVLVDSGLDKENLSFGKDPEEVVKAVKLGLTDEEKRMTVKEWVMYNAKRGEEKLRGECERLLGAFEIEARRAVGVLEGLGTVD